MSADPVRRRAWTCLRDVAAGEGLDEVLGAALAEQTDDRDRRFLAELVRGTLQWQGRYDHLVARFSRRKGAPRLETRLVLRLGLHQLLACDRVPSYAAVDQSVRLARAVAGARTAPYVNGLLHAVDRELTRVGGEVAALRSLFPDPEREAAAHLAAWHSHPRWLVARWLDRFGYAETDALCACDNRRPPVACHVLPPADPADVAAALVAEGIDARPGSLCARALLLPEGLSRAELGDLLAAQPALMVQDEAVQAATGFLCAGAEAPALDLCAAPGGKTLRLRAELGAQRLLVAADGDPRRLPLVAGSAARTGLGPDLLVAADGRRAPFADGAFATVLLDGPCSGTGVLRRHPDGRWRVGPEHLARSAARLGELAREAYRLTRPGGRLLYATCSLEPEENEGVVDNLRGEYPDLVPDGDATDWRRVWLPQRDGADGFFAARLRRTEAGA